MLRCLAVVVPVACVMGGIEVGLVVGVRHKKERHVEWPAVLMAVLSAVLLAAGVGRHYIDIYIHRTVRGISFIFVFIDALGDVFSLVSVLFQPKLDVLGLVIYGTELVLWIGVMACGAYYNLMPWFQKKQLMVGGARDAPAHTATSLDVPEGGAGMVVASGIALHNLPSSTSVFRTPSGELEVIRRGGNGCTHRDGILDSS